MYLVQLSKSGKCASGKKVALNTLILSKIEAPSARLLNCNIFLATLQYLEELSCLRHICLILIVHTLIFSNIEALGGLLMQGLLFFQTEELAHLIITSF
jgi:hypothetical protein